MRKVKQTWTHYNRIQIEDNDQNLLTKVLEHHEYGRSLDTKLRFFQYKLQLKRLNTNIDLSKWKEDQTDRCTYCQTHPETIIHLFWECEVIKSLWRDFQSWSRNELGLTVDLK